MAGAPAYRYDYADARPAGRRAPRIEDSPRVSVVRGTKATSNPTLSEGAILGLKIAVALIACFLVIGFIRVGIASAAYEVASQASQVRSDISDARSTAETLAVEKSSVANPATLRQEAEEKLHMSAPSKTTTMVLAEDVVATDAAGQLSLSASVERVAAQG